MLVNALREIAGDAEIGFSAVAVGREVDIGGFGHFATMALASRAPRQARSTLILTAAHHLVTRLVLLQILWIKPDRLQLLVDKQLHLVGVMR